MRVLTVIVFLLGFTCLVVGLFSPLHLIPGAILVGSGLIAHSLHVLAIRFPMPEGLESANNPSRLDKLKDRVSELVKDAHILP